ncbi:MarR family transcriptional regulator, partial [Streptomyces sp. NPDC007346]
PTPPQPLRIECTNCGRPGPPQALPDGLCRPCRQAHSNETDDTPAGPTDPTGTTDIKARMANLRSLLKPV